MNTNRFSAPGFNLKKLLVGNFITIAVLLAVIFGLTEAGGGQQAIVHGLITKLAPGGHLVSFYANGVRTALGLVYILLVPLSLVVLGVTGQVLFQSRKTKSE